ncbi:MAG: ornithine cyclodeaminase family protein [Xanthomonadales bacterium]|jgi:ornithine cyclodeaminase|nr:ornithine cyclodeaminase family protein [Xanthomonadales bacterium]MDH4000843.1 ornithine cyclodeaminase family protein [Xanthomonadales bacterium]
MSLLIIRAAEIRELVSMAECIEVMERAMKAYSANEVTLPPRTIAPLSDDRSFFILMPGEMQSPAIYGAKILGLHPDNPQQGRPAVQGFVALFDSRTGNPVALADGAEITAVRTAAASALATRVLARPDAASHGILGTGVQAASHLDAICCVRTIRSVSVWGRDQKKAEHFAEQHTGRLDVNITAVADPAEAGACDIVSVVTNSPKPVLAGSWLQPGAHVNLVGAHEPHEREADTEAVTRSAVYVDSLKGALAEAGDILIPIAEGTITRDHIVGAIGDVLLGNAPGRRDQQQITLYKSLGLFAQDLYASEFLLEKALRTGKGLSVEFP